MLGKNWYEGLLERVFIFPESHDVAGVTFIIRTAFLYLFWLLLIKKSPCMCKILHASGLGAFEGLLIIHLWPTHPFTYVSHLSTHISSSTHILLIYLLTYPITPPPTYISSYHIIIHPSLHLPPTHLWPLIHTSTHSPIYFSICLSVYPPVHPSIHHLSIHPISTHLPMHTSSLWFIHWCTHPLI